MISVLFESVCGNPWIIALGTVAFFTLKGLAWLIVPTMMIRWRNRRVKKLRREIGPNGSRTPQVPAKEGFANFEPR